MPKGGSGGASGAITGNKRDNVLTGTEAADVIDGGAGNDTLEGLGGDDTLIGGEGADSLIGGAGSDSIDGGEGADTVVLSGNRDDYVVTQIDAFTVEISGSDGTDVIANVESFQFADMTQTLAEVVIARDPNLSAANLAAGAAQVVEGEALILGWNLTSDGVVDAESSVTQLLIATAPDAGSVVQTIDTAPTGTLATGTTTAYSDSIDTTGWTPGTYYIAAVADGTGLLDESNETDNATAWVEIVVLAAEPNLAAGNIAAADVAAVEGDSLAVTWDLVSDGTIDAASSVTQLVIATAPDMGSVIQSFGAMDTGVLTTGTTASYTGNVDTTGLVAGTYWVAAVADAGNVLAESDEADNVSGWVQIVVEDQRVDYSINSAAVLGGDFDLNVPPGSSDPGGFVVVEHVIENAGNTGATLFEITAYLSTDGVLSADDLILPSSLGGGPALVTVQYGETTSFTAFYDIAEDIPGGDYQVITVISAAGAAPGVPADDPADNVALAAQPVTLIGNRYYGTDGDDLFIGDETYETFRGGAGDDTLRGDVEGDVFHGGEGVDTLDLSDMTEGWVVSGGPDETYGTGLEIFRAVTNQYGGEEPPTGYADGVERLIGSDFDDGLGGFNSTVTYFDGGAGNDQLVGSYADDILLGGLGDDFIFGHFGDDTMTGGEGNDTFYGVSSDALDQYSPNGHDVVTDFDIAMDMLLIVYDPNVGIFDPFANLTQTAEGALVTIAADSSILLQGVDVFDLNASNLGAYEDNPYVSTYG